MFLANLFDEKISATGGGEPLVVWDESHGQFWNLGTHSMFEAYAEDQGYDLQASDDLLSDAPPTLEFPSTASQVAANGTDPLTNSDNIVIWAESTAFNIDNNEDDEVNSPDSTDIPLISRDGNVFGFGTPELVNDDGITENNEQLLLNLLGDAVGGSGALLWDDAHGTFYDLSRYTTFSETVTAEGYEFLSSGDSILEYSTGGGIDELEFFSTSSILNGAGDPLTDGSHVAVAGEDTAYTNTDDYRNEDDPVGEGPEIPLVAVDGGVVAIGSGFASDGSDFDANRTMLVNVWEDRIGGTGTVLYDETHGQNNTLGEFSQLETVAEDRGFTVDAITSDFEGSLSGVDGVMIATDNDDISAFSGSELTALSDFVANGGTLSCTTPAASRRTPRPNSTGYSPRSGRTCGSTSTRSATTRTTGSIRSSRGQPISTTPTTRRFSRAVTPAGHRRLLARPTSSSSRHPRTRTPTRNSPPWGHTSPRAVRCFSSTSPTSTGSTRQRLSTQSRTRSTSRSGSTPTK